MVDRPPATPPNHPVTAKIRKCLTRGKEFWIDRALFF
jgi:hypothetical protein